MKRILISTLMMLMMGWTISAQEWVQDIHQAKQIASSENKVIVLVFAGSDWCGPCIKLEKNIWESNQFQQLSKDSFVMLKADFPRRKENQLSKEQQKHNEQLAELYNPSGNFPLVVVLNANGSVKGKVGYENVTPQVYYEKLKSL